MRVIVLGANGMLGRRLIQSGESRGFAMFGLGRDQVDFQKTTFSRDLESRALEIKPDLIVNSAAYTHVDLAELHGNLAFHINGIVPGVLARFCAERNIPFLHFSTDYVFSGTAPSEGWKEGDKTKPINLYANSKLLGETKIQEVAEEYPEFKFLIIRTSWIYDFFGENFFVKMIHSLQSQKAVQVVADQWGIPNFCGNLAIQVFSLAELCVLGKAKGLLHLSASGGTSRFEFAKLIFEHLKALGVPLAASAVLGVSSEQYRNANGGVVIRPLDSRLVSERLTRLGIAVPRWEEGFKQCFKEWASHV